MYSVAKSSGKRQARCRQLLGNAFPSAVVRVAFLAACGALATALVALLPMPVRVPGHAIFKAALPLAIGVAIVRRPFVGTIAMGGASVTALVFLVIGIGHLQSAALVSLLATGPAMDLALHNTRGDGWRVCTRFAVAGLSVNTLAFVVRWGVALLQIGTLHPLNFLQTVGGALLSFVACGLLAGLVSGAVCFRAQSRCGSLP